MLPPRLAHRVSENSCAILESGFGQAQLRSPSLSWLADPEIVTKL
jgi:hypothetical protein